MTQVLGITLLSFAICFGMQITNKSSQSNEEKTLDSRLLSMLRRYEGGSTSTGPLSVPYPDSVFAEIRVDAGGDSVKKLLDNMGIRHFEKQITIGRIPCYVKARHLRKLADHPYIGSIRIIHAGLTR